MKNWKENRKERDTKFKNLENILNFGTNKIGITNHVKI